MIPKNKTAKKGKSQASRWYRPPRSFNHGRFTFEEPLGKGGFAFVFGGKDTFKNHDIAIKVENKERKNASRSIKKEYRLLYNLCKAECPVPKVYWCGRCDNRRVMVMERMGDSLSDYFKLCGKRFTFETGIRLTIELINILESLHNAGVLHRDIKLQNFLTGYRDNTMVAVCDFGLSDYYIDPTNNQHIECTSGHSRYGTVRYASLNNHRGIEQARRDDLESLGYVMIYATKGSVPWQQIRDEDRRKKWSKVYNMKCQIKLEELCERLPSCFLKFMKAVRKLEFADKPDYDGLRKIFNDSYTENGVTRTGKYDWETAIE